MGKEWIISKRPRDIPIKDIPIAFQKFDNLHLELIEVKSKLTPGLPLIIPKIIQKKKEENRPVDMVIENTPSSGIPELSTKDKYSKKKDKDGKKKDKKEKRRDKKHKHRDIRSAESDSVDEIMIPIAASSSDDDQTPKHKPKSKKEEKSFSLSSSEDDVKEDLGESSVEEEEGEDGEEGEEEEDEYAGLTPEEKLAKQKEEYLWRFRILKKKYKNADIPAFNEHSDFNMMKLTYDRTVKELFLDDSVDSYRQYLMGGFVLMEYVATKWGDIDLEGFARQQKRMMPKYDRLIIELGEKSYSTWGSNIPVEVRLIGLILFNAAIFYIGKVIASKYGDESADFFIGMTGQASHHPPTKDAQTDTAPKAKMRGPRINPADLQ